MHPERTIHPDIEAIRITEEENQRLAAERDIPRLRVQGVSKSFDAVRNISHYSSRCLVATLSKLHNRFIGSRLERD